MKYGKSVRYGSIGKSVPGMTLGGLVHANAELGSGGDVGSSCLVPNVVGAATGPLQAGRGSATAANPKQVTTPDSQVRVRRRRLTREYKTAALQSLDKLKGKPGAVGEFLRKEGLYSATVAYWRKQRNEGTLGKARGRKPTPAEVLENAALKKENLKLKQKIGQYQLVIEAQKKISEILGVRQDNLPPMPDPYENE